MNRNLIVVTGAGGTLGRAVVKRLVAEAMPVWGIDISPALPSGFPCAFTGGVDLADPVSVDGAVARISSEYSCAGGLVNVAGGFCWETLAEGSIETWERLYRMNLLTAATMSRAMLPLLRPCGGAIVNVSAAATSKAAAGMGAYAASKSAVARLTESLADEEGKWGIRVNAVLPTVIDTPANRSDIPDADPAAWVSPEAVADVINFLLSGQARAISGASIPLSMSAG